MPSSAADPGLGRAASLKGVEHAWHSGGGFGVSANERLREVEYKRQCHEHRKGVHRATYTALYALTGNK